MSKIHPKNTPDVKKGILEKITRTSSSSWTKEKWSMKKIIIVKILLLISQCSTVVLCLSTGKSLNYEWRDFE